MYDMSTHDSSLQSGESSFLLAGALAEIQKSLRKGTLSHEDVKRIVEHYRDTPLSEIERELGIEETNDIRERAGYSKSPLYRIVRKGARLRRRAQVEKLIGSRRGNTKKD